MTISETLEERARGLATNLKDKPERLFRNPREAELVLTLDHLDELELLQQTTERQILKSECYVGSDLLKLSS